MHLHEKPRNYLKKMSGHCPLIILQLGLYWVLEDSPRVLIRTLNHILIKKTIFFSLIITINLSICEYVWLYVCVSVSSISLDVNFIFKYKRKLNYVQTVCYLFFCRAFGFRGYWILVNTIGKCNQGLCSESKTVENWDFVSIWE